MSESSVHYLPATEPRAEETPQPSAKYAPPSYSWGWSLALVLADLTMFIVSWIAAVMIGYKHWDRPGSLHAFIISTPIYIALWLALFERLGLYRRTSALSMKDELYYTVTALSLGVLPQLVLFTIVPLISTSRIVLLLALALSIVSVGATRAALHGMRTASMMRRRRRVAIVGRPDRIAGAASHLGIRETAEQLIIPIDDIDQTIHEINLTEDSELERISWFRQARDWRCDTLIMTEIVPSSVLPHLLEVAARHQILFAFAPPRIQCHSYYLSLRTDGHQVLIVPSQLRACTPRARLVKRLMDIVLASVALVLAAPVMLLAALAVWIESGRPIIYRQERVGLHGVVFDILKFRSMRVDAEKQSGAIWVQEDDPRRTRVGTFLRRTSIDELPQFINVLHGEMSLVGPRPERPVFVERFRKMFPRYDERHLVPPGITGLSHVHMERVLKPTEIAERLSYDLYYVEEWSPFLDISVLIQTAVEFLFHRAG